MALIGALAFVLALLVSVVLHEFGHFATAKAFGMKATQFFVGFGPTLWSRKKGETEYGIKAIPAGGFVKIVGMTPLEELEGEDDDKRAFFRFPAGRRAIVLVAGSTMHFILAIVVVFIALLIAPVQTSAAAISAPAPCVAADLNGSCSSSAPASPAKAAGLQDGDKILRVGGTSVSSWTQLAKAIQADKGAKPLAVTYERDGKIHSTTITPVLQTRKQSDGSSKQVPVFGIMPAAAALRRGDGGPQDDHHARLVHHRHRELPRALPRPGLDDLQPQP